MQKSENASRSPSTLSSSSETISHASEEKFLKETRTVRKGIDRRAKSSFANKNFWHRNFAEKIAKFVTHSAEKSYVITDKDPKRRIHTRQPSADLPFILWNALLPMSVQLLSEYFYPQLNWSLATVFGVYSAFHLIYLVLLERRVSALGVKYGTWLEYDIGRDRISDELVNELAIGVVAAPLIRISSAMVFATNFETFSFNLWTFYPRFIIWTLAFDFLFGAWHRMTHQAGANGYMWLWSIHSSHHAFKRSTTAGTIVTGTIELIYELALPAAVFYFMPFSFSEAYLTVLLTGWQEAAEHGGVRLHWGNPAMNWVMAPWNMGFEVTSEGHDLHHRYGMSGKGYGSLTAFWDVLFGTQVELIETKGMRF